METQLCGSPSGLSIYLEKILDFIQEHLKYHDRELLADYIKQHEKFGTLDYALDTNNNIVAVCRWNVSDDGKVASVLDFAIAGAYRRKGIGRDFIERAMRKFSKIEKIEFQRSIRGDERFRKVNIQGIIKRRIF